MVTGPVGCGDEEERGSREWRVNTEREKKKGEKETSVRIWLISILLITPLDKICYEWRWLLYLFITVLYIYPHLSSSRQLAASFPHSLILSVPSKISLSLSDAVHSPDVLSSLALWTRTAWFKLQLLKAKYIRWHKSLLKLHWNLWNQHSRYLLTSKIGQIKRNKSVNPVLHLLFPPVFSLMLTLTHTWSKCPASLTHSCSLSARKRENLT